MTVEIETTMFAGDAADISVKHINSHEVAVYIGGRANKVLLADDAADALHAQLGQRIAERAARQIRASRLAGDAA